MLASLAKGYWSEAERLMTLFCAPCLKTEAPAPRGAGGMRVTGSRHVSAPQRSFPKADLPQNLSPRYRRKASILASAPSALIWIKLQLSGGPHHEFSIPR